MTKKTRRLGEAALDNIKFFPRDVIEGKANKKGDVFVAILMGSKFSFEVISRDGDVIFAKLIRRTSHVRMPKT